MALILKQCGNEATDTGFVAQDEWFVRFFGDFQINRNNQNILDTASRGHRPWRLFQYLVANRNTSVSRQQLVEVLWPDGESDQPEKALKNVVYRIRSFFASLENPPENVLEYKNGSYAISPQLNLKSDFELFEEYYDRASNSELCCEERIGLYRKSIALYRGNFLEEHVYEGWVLPLNAHYRTRYFKCIGQLLPLLQNQNAYEDIEDICRHALTIDAFHEPMHEAYLNAMIQQGKKTDAIRHYSHLTDLFFHELGIAPNSILRDMYSDLNKVPDFLETDLFTIKQSLDEKQKDNKAFYCSFDVFSDLYRLEVRAMERTGQSVFLALLTIEDKSGPEVVLNAAAQENAMPLLLQSIHTNLRCGDVVSLFSKLQYILMLPTVTMENGNMVLNRISKTFNSICSVPELSLTSKIQPMGGIL